MNPPDEKIELSEQPWLQQAVGELRQPVAPSVAGQLRAARRTALEQNTAKQRWMDRLSFSGFPGWGMTFVAGLGAAVVALMVFLGPQAVSEKPSLQAKPNNGGTMLEDLSIMAAQEDLEFYQDLELLQWLDKEEGLDAQS